MRTIEEYLEAFTGLDNPPLGRFLLIPFERGVYMPSDVLLETARFARLIDILLHDLDEQFGCAPEEQAIAYAHAIEDYNTVWNAIAAEKGRLILPNIFKFIVKHRHLAQPDCPEPIKFALMLI